MRIVEVDGRKISVRGLKRSEVREFRAKKVNFIYLDPDTAEETMDLVFKLVISEEDMAALEDMQNSCSIAVWSACLKETFGAPDEEKNS